MLAFSGEFRTTFALSGEVRAPPAFSGEIRTSWAFSGDIWTLSALRASESRPTMRAASRFRPTTVRASESRPRMHAASRFRPATIRASRSRPVMRMAPQPHPRACFARAVSRTHPAPCFACDQFHPLAFPARLKTPSFMQSTEYKMFPRGKMSVGDRDEREARGGSELCEPQVSGEIAPGLMVVLTGPNERSRE